MHLSIGAAAIHEVLLHGTSTLCTDHLLWYATTYPRKDEAVAVLRGMEFVQLVIEGWHKALFLGVLCPRVKLFKACQNCVAIGSCHLG